MGSQLEGHRKGNFLDKERPDKVGNGYRGEETVGHNGLASNYLVLSDWTGWFLEVFPAVYPLIEIA